MSYPLLPSAQLTLVGVADPGVPNLERILLRPVQQTGLAGFGVGIGMAAGTSAYGIYDNVFWFPEKVVEPPSWILLFTGRGKPTDTMLDSGERAHVFYWQRQNTVFTDPGLVPFVFLASAVVVGRWLPSLR